MFESGDQILHHTFFYYWIVFMSYLMHTRTCITSPPSSHPLTPPHTLVSPSPPSPSDWFSATDDTGAYLIDRSPLYFEPLLNFLRHGKLIINEGTNPQGTIVQIDTLINALTDEYIDGLIHSHTLTNTHTLTDILTDTLMD